ncbi:exodeoxyribonuclease VII small subunit [Helicobacter cinaedi]|uniref:exodeoxyribonuclease VII small subunit n=1 Tax=Helicobacter cinaedi TaxID=213 RepID=UPI000CF1378A|nr:exodeoxyribonuclease VII small subunit [Helicobacter cinaedi]AWK61029.1 exodeoxyribonuclease VII small subunit [Helicobacter cinaedi]QOQ96577.1 exodeoxyribonuclease VII small subunit [Helicobacter cinaedi]
MAEEVLLNLDSQDSQIPQESQEDEFETMLEKAKAVLNKLNSQEVTLKESLALYESGMRYLKDAQEILEQAQLQYQEFKG